MNNDELRQFAMLQLELTLNQVKGFETTRRIWAALYCVQAMDGGPRPLDFDQLIEAVTP